MNVIKVSPRGYCHGVVTAMNLVTKTLCDPNTVKPVYILGQIVHNKNVTEAFLQAGATTIDGNTRVEILDKVTSGTVIVTAHGINPSLIEKAKSKGLIVMDATCIDVYKTHDVIKEKLKKGYEVLYIGKKNHPEPEGAVSINPEKIHLITSLTDIDNVEVKCDKICITNQTTMSMWDVEDIMEYSKVKFPDIEIINEICLATQQRQEAVLKLATDADLTIVVGDPKSNNTNKLVEISIEKAKTKAYRISDVTELDPKWLLDEKVNTVAVTSGASTPTIVTKIVVDFIEQFEKLDPKTHSNYQKLDLRRIVPRNRKN